MLKIHIDTGNDAFVHDAAAELKYILKDVSFTVWTADLSRRQKHTIRDSNGNKVGEWEYKP